MQEESWRGNHEEGIMKEEKPSGRHLEASGRHLEASGAPWRHSGRLSWALLGSLVALWDSRGMGGILEV